MRSFSGSHLLTVTNCNSAIKWRGFNFARNFPCDRRHSNLFTQSNTAIVHRLTNVVLWLTGVIFCRLYNLFLALWRIPEFSCCPLDPTCIRLSSLAQIFNKHFEYVCHNDHSWMNLLIKGVGGVVCGYFLTFKACSRAADSSHIPFCLISGPKPGKSTWKIWKVHEPPKWIAVACWLIC